MNPSSQASRSTLRRGVLLGVAALASFFLAGDRGLTQASSGGIDPLEILKLQVRPNVIVVLDSSGSMKEEVASTGIVNGVNNGEFVGDDPLSKMGVAKTVLRKIVANNKNKISFQFGQYTQAEPIDIADRNRFYYMTPDPNANGLTINSGGDGSTAPGIKRGTGDKYTIGGVTYYYLFAGKLWNGEKIDVGTKATLSTGTKGDVPPSPTSTPLAGPWPAGTGKRPYVELTNGTTTVRFWMSGVYFNKTGDLTDGTAGNTCDGFKSLVSLADCLAGDTQVTAINPYLDPEVFYDPGNGDILGYADGTLGNSPNTMPAIINGTTPVGVKAAGFTPIANSLRDIRTKFWAGGLSYWTNRISVQTPGQRQKTFVLFVTDGDDTCADSNDDLAAKKAAAQAELLYTPVAGGASKVNTNGTIVTGTDSAESVQTFFIAFGAAAGIQRSNWIAWGGSGVGTWSPITWTGGSASTNTQIQTARNNCQTCADAFLATDAAALEAALQNALDRGAGVGEFSDQQSITESIFELGGDATRAIVTPTVNVLDPNARYSTTIPVLLQSTFELPSYAGHLNAFANKANAAFQLWDAGDMLCKRVTGLPASPSTVPDVCDQTAASVDPTAMGVQANTYTFAQLHGGATLSNISASSARIKRRIFTTSGNGVNSVYTAQKLVDLTASPSGAFGLTGIWPPDPTVAPGGNPDPAGDFDNQLGIASMSFAQLKTTFGACVGSNLPSRCTGTPAQQLAKAQREAREMILAFTAGAQVVLDVNGQPSRDASNELLYQARPWMLAESTLAAPAVVTPPLVTAPSFHGGNEYKLFTEGPRNVSNTAVNAVQSGFGLRNPDKDGQPASAADNTLKPMMSVVYHATNAMLHAFRGGPCPTSVTACGGETGGEELWAFVPYDQLGKLLLRMKPQGRTNHTYMMAAPIRFADVFVTGNWNKTYGSGAGVWRTLLFVGRGAGGKYISAIDVTAPGPFTAKSLNAQLPIVVWSRGNPDTNDGNCKSGSAGCTVSASNSYNFDAADYAAFAKMGETWSVPAVGFVTAANNTTTRKPSTGTEFAAWVGSGFSSVTTEGKTFYALDAFTGDVIASHDIPDGTSAASIQNSLVASVSAFAPKPLSFVPPPPAVSTGVNPATELVTAVYFPDLHSRIWRFIPDSPATAPTVFADFSTDGDQPIANPVALINVDTNATSAKPHVFAESGNDSRVPAPQVTPLFRAYALRDEGATSASVFTPIDFQANFRGTAQPATGFNGNGFARVFFAATRFNPPGADCRSSFDSLIFALQAADGGAAYDLGGADPRYVTMTGQRVNQLRVQSPPEGGTGGATLVIDTGLNAQNAPPPPAPAVIGSSAPPTTSNVALGTKVPGSVAYKLGSSVCN